jgi:hypothetical protein
MLITFKSSASGDVIMLEENGKDLLRLLGKDPDALKGIVTVEQLPGAMNALKAAIEADKERLPDQQADAENESEDDSGGAVHLFQRVLPLLELMERSLKGKVPVTWGL